jgi:hypothetical protein
MAVKVQTETKGAVLSDLLLYEVDYRWSRQQVSLAATEAALPMGTVLEVSSTTGSYSALGITTTGESGSQTSTVNAAVAVLLDDAPISTSAQDVMVLLRGAVVAGEKLHFGSTITADMKKTAKAALTTLGIVVKE